MDAIKKIKNPKIRLVVIIAVVVIAAIIALYELISAPSQTADTKNTFLSAHFIDVGQGDCTLFVSGDKTMLIDSGEAEYGDTVVSYIKKLGITELDYVVATHAHSDHMGSMAYVIENFDVKNISLTFANTFIIALSILGYTYFLILKSLIFRSRLLDSGRGLPDESK